MAVGLVGGYRGWLEGVTLHMHHTSAMSGVLRNENAGWLSWAHNLYTAICIVPDKMAGTGGHILGSGKSLMK